MASGSQAKPEIGGGEGASELDAAFVVHKAPTRPKRGRGHSGTNSCGL